MSYLVVKQGDYGFYIQMTALNVDGTPVDLTGKTVYFVLETISGQIWSGQCSVTNPTSGQCQFLIPKSIWNTISVGSYHSYLSIIDATGVITANEASFYVLP